MAVLNLILQGIPEAKGIKRTGSGHHQAQRMDRREEVPPGALPHDWGHQYGIWHPGRLR